MRRNAASVLLVTAALAAAATVFIVLTGGVSFHTPLLILQDPRRPALAALVLLAAWLAVAPAPRRAVLAAAAGWPDRAARRAALLAAACAFVFAIAWTSRAAGGSDSSCYVLQAEAFAQGHVTLDNRVATILPAMPNEVFAPVGFLPARDYGHAVPICGPGLSLAMAMAYLVRPTAVFFVVPVTAALLVWLTFVFGRRVDDDLTGALAAVLVACSPIFLYQAVQPMSDVPAAAAWMAALVSASPLGAGVCASIAVLVRPNLALLVPLLFLQHTRSRARLLAGLLPGVLGLLVLNLARYGSPLATGYGSADALFTRAHVSANLLRYPRWVLETHTPFVLLAIAAPWLRGRDPARARLAWVSLAAAALLAATYLAYTVFDDWWYIRFLLPAVPMVLGLAVAAARRLTAAIAPRAAVPVIAVLVALLGGFYVRVARDRHVMDLQRLESRFRLTGEYAAGALPANAVVLAVQQSGSIRFHGGRDTIAWDAIPGDRLDQTIADLRARGRHPYAALEELEEPRFRLRFARQRLGGLEWRPLATIDAPTPVRVYDLAR